ncbi:MAG: hypothetical protein B7X47_04925 [Ferrovum sp. 34-44-207]|nr:MAG: hypothetical protein B7X47_04925 [Ferrovum sp. 34-44-207]
MNASAQGVWQGTSATGYTLDLIVLPNNQFIDVFGTPIAGNGLIVDGYDAGTGSISGSSLTSNITEYNSSGQSLTGTFNGTVVTGSSISGSVSFSNGNTSSTFSLSPLSGFNYNTQATLVNVGGIWNGTFLGGGSATITVNSSTGAFSGVSSAGCNFIGTITPVANVNAYTTSITLGSSPCANPGMTASGVAVIYPTNTGITQLIAQANSGSLSAMFFAQR